MNFIDKAMAEVTNGEDFVQKMADIYEYPEVREELENYPTWIRNIITVIDYDTELAMDGLAPKDSLATGIYRATLTVTAANAQIATTELQFTVNEHDYVAVVTPPNCTEKGYTTYTCRNCSHSYKGNEVDATGHTWGEWKVIKEATTTETGKKERVCERCDYKEIAVISMISNKEQPTTSTKPDTAVKTGDSTNILLWSMVMVISLAGMLTALFFKRRRNR